MEPRGSACQGTFDNFNLVVAGFKGELEDGIGRIYDTLMTPSFDEVGTVYGLACRGGPLSGRLLVGDLHDQSRGRFHDGKPITVDDVIFSFTTLKTQSPFYAQYYQRTWQSVEKTGDREVTFKFAEKGNRELPQIVSEFPILPKHWWEGTGPDGRPRDVTQTTLEIAARVGGLPAEKLRGGADRRLRAGPGLLGARPQREPRQEQFRRDPQRVLSRHGRAARGLQGRPVRLPHRERRPQLGDRLRLPAVREGRVVKEEFPERSSGVMQAFVFNLRRDKFKDERVRRAFNLAFDFEDINRTIFYGLYKRIDSYFFGTELASSGLPQGEELAILEPLRDKVPAAVFTDALPEPRQRHDRSRAGEPARSRAPPAGGRLRAARSANRRQEPASPSRSNSSATTRPSSATPCPTSRRSSGSASR